MKSFFLFNEHGEDGPSILAPLTIFSDRPVLWSPSGKLLQRSFDLGLTGINPDGFLKLVESGFVRVAGRADWLVNGDLRRQSSWELSEYSHEFDGKLLKILEEDATSANPRVIALNPEEGYSFADRAITERDESYIKAVAYVRIGAIPKGTRERIERKKAQLTLTDVQLELISVRELLRDARNHYDAARAVGADISVSDALGEAVTLADVAMEEPSPLGANIAFDRDRFLHAIDFADRISGKEHTDGLLNILHDKKERALILDLMRSTLPIEAAIRNQMIFGVDQRNAISEVFGEKTGEHIAGLSFSAGAALTAYSAVQYMYSKKMSRRVFLAGFSTVLGGAASNADKIQNLLELNSAVPEMDYSGPKWYFLLRCGTVGPTRNLIEEQIRILSER